ncbi:PREDICTED: histone acetyltransferase KAT6B-like [Branchiostoma belcheri]|uniref:Histone acetyltransferase KAT6B-like n=1 Tax=Branchiostoma belcheri TaxID=7741 RepID=A0A6P4ZSD2_BRABE|nr:PREDICTED: histone acetyltransferase KAT6B-like [Branchiostoma belcheri]
MSAPKYTEWILETIDSLRKRKARPDVDRICHMVERRHGVKSAEIAADLERLVDADIVIKVEYKGSTSYRNAAKWKKSHLSGIQLNSQRASHKVLAAVRGLFAVGPGGSRAAAGGSEGEEAGSSSTRGATQGVTPTDIENYLRQEDSSTNLTGDHLLTVLQREVEAARLVRTRTGEYVLPGGQKPASSPKKTSPAGAAAPARFTKRKRIKKTHGPDFEQEPLVKSPSDPRCDYCLLTSECNRSGEEEDLLICKDCNAKAHPSCMRYSADLARRSRMSPWQCIDCKTCYICDDSGDAETLLFCDACDKGYHMACHEPAVTHKPLGKWVCQRCKDDTGMEIDEDSMDTGETSPHKSPPQLINGIAERKQTKQTSGDRKSQTVATPTQPESACLPEQSASVMEALQKKKPVAAAWAITDVVDFIKEVGFEKEAEAFQEQEIDGPAFLLLKRSDVLTGMSIKLGPALKIYNHVMKVQTNTHPSL